MKIKFCYRDFSDPKKHCLPIASRIRRTFKILDAPENMRRAYTKYLLDALESDFDENDFGLCDEVLRQIARIDSREIESYVFSSNGFTHQINREFVIFEHAIFSVCPHWPLWSCPLSHYKIGLQAARDFYAMPESLDTELIVELPETEMAKVVIFPPLLAERKPP